MLRFLRTLRSAPKPPPVSVDTSTLAPQHAVFAVGDIHGRADLLEPLLDRIESHPATQTDLPVHHVFLGDYVDRGDRSAQVLARLFALDVAPMVTCLMGNHERMMLDFIDDPAGRGARWLINGGVETLESFGINGISAKSTLEQMTQAADALAAAMPDGMQAWLRALPLYWQSGNLVCVHAAMDPARAPSEQKDRTLLWGHQSFLNQAREDGLWIAHGHTIVRTPEIVNRRIAVDTGAWQSGRLTAAAISARACVFL